MTIPVRGTTLNAHFWQAYENCLIKNSINAQQVRWYIGWCQQFVQFLGKRPLSDCQPEHVSAFLDNLQGNAAIKDWQWGQARHALWYLFRDHLQIPWAVGKSCSSPVAKEKFSFDSFSAAHQSTLQKMRSTLIGRQYAKRTQTAYLDWATRFLWRIIPTEKLAIWMQIRLRHI